MPSPVRCHRCGEPLTDGAVVCGCCVDAVIRRLMDQNRVLSQVVAPSVAAGTARIMPSRAAHRNGTYAGR